MKNSFTQFVLICSSIMLATTNAFSQNCFESSITSPTPFMGNNGEVFKLGNGTIGEVIAEYEYMYEYYPTVIVCPERSVLVIKGKKLNIKILSENNSISKSNEPPTKQDKPVVIESKIDDDFEGYDYENIYKLRNGQIWEQVSAKYKYKYKYAPSVIIVNREGQYYLQVEGMEDWVVVQQIK